MKGHLVAALCVAGLASPLLADTWAMKQRDMHNTGRAGFTVPENRLNDTFFDIFLWQTRSPGSPGRWRVQ